MLPFGSAVWGTQHSGEEGPGPCSRWGHPAWVPLAHAEGTKGVSLSETQRATFGIFQGESESEKDEKAHSPCRNTLN